MSRARVWTDEQILQRIRDWAAIYGAPPACGYWHTGQPTLHPDFRAGEWPSEFVVFQRFGSWRRAIQLAGLEPVGHPRKPSPTKTCPACGVSFTRRPDEPRWLFLRRVFCSRRCSDNSSVRVEGAADRTARAIDLRRAGATNTEIGVALRVSAQAVANLLSRARQQGHEVPYG